MVERLKEAIEKASRERQQAVAEAPGSQPGGAAPAPGAPGAGPGAVPSAGGDAARDALWAALEPVAPPPRRLLRNRVIAADRTDPAHVAFDVLRSRLIKAFRDNGWSRLAITSPTKGCGKTFVSVNLALSLARQPDLRTLLLDMDLRAPAVAQTLGLRGRWPLQEFLTGALPAERYLRRIGDTLALGMNSERVRDAAELILERRTPAILAETVRRLAPDMVIHDLPPMLVNDDAFAFLPNVDAVLLVAGAGETRADQIDACEKLFEGNVAFLGVLLNKVTDSSEDGYGYGYGYA